LAVRLRGEFIEPQRIRDLVPFEQAIKRGELPPDFDTEAAAEQFLSPVYYRLLVSGKLISPSYTEDLLRRLLQTIHIEQRQRWQPHLLWLQLACDARRREF
jgi:hypothetical protein